MSQFVYVAVDSHGRETRGTVSVGSQSEAIRRIKELGFFPTKVAAARTSEKRRRPASAASSSQNAKPAGKGLTRKLNLSLPFLQGRVKPKTLTAFTRQLATLIDAGMPLLRGLRILAEEETNPRLRQVTEDVMVSIEGGGSLSEALMQHPKVFNKLYVNMVKAGELGGVLEIVLNRLAEFLEKAQRIKGKVVSGMFYPVAALVVATAIMAVLMIFVVPKFQAIFADLMNGAPLPAFTTLVLGVSHTVKDQFLLVLGCGVAGVIAFKLFARTFIGRRLTDRAKLKAPLLGPVIRKVSLLEPIMIVALAVIVGSIVIALFLPILHVMDSGF